MHNNHLPHHNLPSHILNNASTSNTMKYNNTATHPSHLLSNHLSQSNSTFVPHLPPPPTSFSNHQPASVSDIGLLDTISANGSGSSSGSSSGSDGSNSRSNSTSLPWTSSSDGSPLQLTAVGKPSAFRPRPKRERSDPTDLSSSGSPLKHTKVLPSPPIQSAGSGSDELGCRSGNGNEADDEDELMERKRLPTHPHHVTHTHHALKQNHASPLQQRYLHHLRPQSANHNDLYAKSQQQPLMLFSQQSLPIPSAYSSAFAQNINATNLPPNFASNVAPIYSNAPVMSISNAQTPQTVPSNTPIPSAAAANTVPVVPLSQGTNPNASAVPNSYSVDDVIGSGRRGPIKAKRAFSDDASNSSNSEDTGSSGSGNGGSGSNASAHDSNGLSSVQSAASKTSLPSLAQSTDRMDSSVATSQMAGGKKLRKKHIVTDRQRRAKIKDGMEQLRGLLSIHGSFTTDQVSIMNSSVQLINRLRTDVINAKHQLGNLKHELDIYRGKYGTLPATIIGKSDGKQTKDKADSNNSRTVTGNELMNDVDDLEALLVQSSAASKHHNGVPVTVSMSLDGLSPSNKANHRLSSSLTKSSTSTDTDPPSDPAMSTTDFPDESDSDSLSADQPNSNNTCVSTGDDSLSSDPSRCTEAPSTDRTSSADNDADPDVAPPLHVDKSDINMETAPRTVLVEN